MSWLLASIQILDALAVATGSVTQQSCAISQGQQVQQSTPTDTYNQEAQPSLMDKAKAYIPVLGNSTDFDPASTGKLFCTYMLHA